MDKIDGGTEYKECRKCGEYHFIPKDKDICLKCVMEMKRNKISFKEDTK